MAKFKNSNIELKTNQEILLGDSQEVSITYDDSAMMLDTTAVIASGTLINYGHSAFGADSFLDYGPGFPEHKAIMRIDEDMGPGVTGWAVGLAVGVDSAGEDAAANTMGVVSIAQNDLSTLQNQVIGVYGFANVTKTGAVVTDITGIQAGASCPATNGTITNMYGVDVFTTTGFGMTGLTFTKMAAAQFQLLKYGSGAPDIVDAYSVLIKTPGYNPSGTNTNLYGLYIEDQSPASFTNEYNIYSAGVNSKNYFEGDAEIVGILTVENLTTDSTAGIIIDSDLTADTYFGDGSQLSGVLTGPAGNDNEVQFNDNGTLAGSSNLAWTGSVLQVGGSNGINLKTDGAIGVPNGTLTLVGGSTTYNQRSHIRLFNSAGVDIKGSHLIAGHINGGTVNIVAGSNAGTADGGDVILESGSGGVNDGSIIFKHAGNTILETDTTAGIIVTGDIHCDDLFTSGDTIHIGSGQIKSTAGNIELYDNGIKVLETTTEGFNIFDTNGNDPTINFKDDGGVTLSKIISVGSALVGASSTGEWMWRGFPNGGFFAYHDGDLAFNTEATGIAVSDTNGNDPTIQFYTDSVDLQAQIIASDTAMTMTHRVGGVAWETFLVANKNGSVDLYYDDTKVFETDTTGIIVTGDITATTYHGDGSQLSGIVHTTPAGNNNEVQYNNNGEFGASQHFTFTGSAIQIGTSGIQISAYGDIGRANNDIYVIGGSTGNPTGQSHLHLQNDGGAILRGSEPAFGDVHGGDVTLHAGDGSGVGIGGDVILDAGLGSTNGSVLVKVGGNTVGDFSFDQVSVIADDSYVKVVDDGTASGYIEIVADAVQVAYFDAEAASIRLGKASAAANIELTDIALSIDVNGNEFVNIAEAFSYYGKSGETRLYLSPTSGALSVAGTNLVTVNSNITTLGVGSTNSLRIWQDGTGLQGYVGGKDVLAITEDTQRIGDGGVNTNILLTNTGNGTIQMYSNGVRHYYQSDYEVLVGKSNDTNMYILPDDNDIIFECNNVPQLYITVNGISLDGETNNFNDTLVSTDALDASSPDTAFVSAKLVYDSIQAFVPTQIAQDDSYVKVVDDGTGVGYVEIVTDGDQVAYFDNLASTQRIGKASGAGRIEISDVGIVSSVSSSALLTMTESNITLGIGGDTNIQLAQSTGQVGILGDGSTLANFLPALQRIGKSSGAGRIDVYTSGVVEFYHTGSKVFETKQDGILIDSAFSITQAGSVASIVSQTHGGELQIKVENSGGTPQLIFAGLPDGASSLYYAGDEKLTTDSTGIIITGDIHCDDLYTSGSSIYLGDAVLSSPSNNFSVTYGGETAIVATKDAGVDLYHNNNKVVATAAGGMNIYSIFDQPGLWWNDSNSLPVGGISHTGTQFKIQNETNGSHIQLKGNDSLAANVMMVDADPDTSVDLYYNGTKVFETLSDGIRLNQAFDITTDSTGIVVNGVVSADGIDAPTLLSNGEWKDINVFGAVLAGGASSVPDLVTLLDENGADTGITTYGFAVGEKAHAGFEMQHDYQEGTDVYFHIHFQGNSAPTGTDNVKFEMTYTIARTNTTLDATRQIDTGDIAYDTQYEMVSRNFGVIDGQTGGPGGGPLQIGDQIMFTVERIAAVGDAYAGDALIMTLGLHYQADSIGSTSPTSK